MESTATCFVRMSDSGGVTVPEPRIASEESAGQPSPLSEPLLRRDEVARFFNVSPRTVSYWAWTGKLPSVRTLGGQYRFRPADIAALVTTAEAV
jgi:excisionase family DNA binding protein